MQRYQAGEESAFTEIYRLTVGRLQGYLSRWVDWQKVGDLSQETYLQMHRARRTYRPELPFRPWLYAIARHVAQQALRTHGRKAGKEFGDEDLASRVTGNDEPQLTARLDLEKALIMLPSDQRESVWLAQVEGLTSKEIARLTGATEGAIRVRIHRGNRKLRELLEREPGGVPAI